MIKIMKESERILFTDFLASMNKKFIESGWITVSAECLHSALVSDEKLSEALSRYEWDLSKGSNGVSEIWSDGKWSFCHDGINVLEPFVLYRSANYDIDNYVELSQDFRVLLNMHDRYVSPTEHCFVVDNENGDWEKVAEIKGETIRIKLTILRKYLALRRMNLLLFFDEMRFSQQSFQELGLTPIMNQIVKDDDYIYNYSSLVNCHADGNKSGGWIMGKCVLRYREKDYNRDSFDQDDRQYAEFIYDYDDEGEPMSYSGKKETLSNYFVANGDNPLEMTPIFFKKEVLDKYYSNPNKYTVSDGAVGCEGSWSLHIDNDHRNYVIVPLVYLGNLDYSEQLYWKGHNVSPEREMGFSKTAYTRWIEGKFCNPMFPDLQFKYRFKQFNKKWEKQFGWPLFLPLIDEDEHRYKTLHCLTTENNHSDFDEQILSITKLVVDSLNQKCLQTEIDDSNTEVESILKERKISSSSELKAGIDKFQAFIFSKGMKNPDVVDFLRKVQSLRSNSVAHRKSNKRKDLAKLYEYFKLDELSEQQVLEDIFVKMIMTLDTLENYFCVSSVL